MLSHIFKLSVDLTSIILPTKTKKRAALAERIKRGQNTYRKMNRSRKGRMHTKSAKSEPVRPDSLHSPIAGENSWERVGVGERAGRVREEW